MSQEFVDWANWFSILDCVRDELFPPLFFELLEDYRCQLSTRDLKRIVSVKNLKMVIAALDQLDKDSHTEAVAQWLQQTNTTVAIVILEAIETIIHKADDLEDSLPVPLTGLEAVRFCVEQQLNQLKLP